MPGIISSDSDVSELDDSVLSTLRESVTAASKAALEVMLVAKKKKKASLDQCVNAVDISILFKTVLDNLACSTERTDQLCTAERQANAAGLVSAYLAAVYVEYLIREHHFQRDDIPLLNAVIKPKSTERRVHFANDA